MTRTIDRLAERCEQLRDELTELYAERTKVVALCNSHCDSRTWRKEETRMKPAELLKFLEERRLEIDYPARYPAMALAQEAVLKKLPDIIFALETLLGERTKREDAK